MKFIKSLFAACAALSATFFIVISPAIADAKKEFKSNRCAQCHTVTGKHTIGPSLKGVMGRKAGTAEGFKASRYSKSMVAAGEKGLVWDAKTLDAFMTNPKQFLRDYLGDPKATTKMGYPGLKDAGKRALIAEYLSTAK